GPLGEEKETFYVISSGTAIIECANISGLADIPHEKRNPDMTTSYGIGQVILDAIQEGCHKLYIGIGGSATMDGGLGMLCALGMAAMNSSGEEVGIYSRDLHDVHQVNLDEVTKT